MSHYNPHRGLGPAPGPGGNARLNELLDGVRLEFENQARQSQELEHSSKSFVADQAYHKARLVPVPLY